MNKKSVEKLKDFHFRTKVFLSYVNPSMRFLPNGNVDFREFVEGADSNWNLRRARKGGVGVMVASMGFGSGPEMFPGKEGVGRQFHVLSSFLDAMSRCRSIAEVAFSYADIKRITSADKIAVLIHLTGLSLDGDLNVLRGFYELGVRSIHPPFDDRQPDADHVEGEKGGLTAFGKKVVEKMNELGMIVDVAHSSNKTFGQVMDISTVPVMDSHSNAASLCRVPRNLTDRQIEKIAANGGVAGIHFGAGFIDKSSMDRIRATGFYEKLAEWEAGLKKRYKDPFKYMSERINPEKWERNPLRKLQESVGSPPLSMLVDHLDHFVRIGGIDHVGIGSDYELGGTPAGLDRVDHLFNLTLALSERGYSKRDLKKLMMGNFMRVMKHVLK